MPKVVHNDSYESLKIPLKKNSSSPDLNSIREVSKKIGKIVKHKYLKYFNSTEVAKYIITKTFEQKNKKNNSNKELNPSDIKNLQMLLSDFGYKITINGLMDKETLKVIYAFESHYCPEELEEFSVKHKLIGYLRNLIKSKNRSLTKKH